LICNLLPFSYAERHRSDSQALRHLRQSQPSQEQEENEPSTGGQVAICRLRLADLDLLEGKVLVDPGRSAWDPTVQRPAWDELMDRLERGVSGGFIVFDLERFTRPAERTASG